MIRWLLLICFGLAGFCEAQVAAPQAPQSFAITDVRLSAQSFNPTQNESVTISYNLSIPAKVTVVAYDPDLGLVKTVCAKAERPQGKNSEIWDGKDEDGSVVPDEAYFFTIEATTSGGETALYDPTTFSGGEEFMAERASFGGADEPVSYTVPFAARTLVRLGVKSGGPLLKTLVDWKPRATGENTIYWDGMDQDGVIKLRDHPGCAMLVTGFKLLENSVVTLGNSATSYRQYKVAKPDRPKKPTRPRDVPASVVISRHYSLPRIYDHALDIAVSFPEVNERTDKGLSIIKDRAGVRVDLADADKQFVTEQRFEIVFFVDALFFAEEEVGYSPYNWVWHTGRLTEGEHVLTVNLSSYKDQIGIRSVKVFIKK